MKATTFFVSVCLLATCPVWAEDPYVVDWSRQIGTGFEGGEDNSRGLAVDGSGNVYMSGDTQGSIGGPAEFNGQEFLIKFDSSGTELWSRQVGGLDIDDNQGVAVDSVGNVYISGQTFDEEGNPPLGGQATLTKFDSSGTLLWAQQFGIAVRGEGSNSVTVDAADNVYITGITSGDPLIGFSDSFLTKFDSSGAELWSQQIVSSTGWVWSYSVAVDDSGNSYITGETVGDLGPTPAGGTDAFLVKFDAGGTKLWTRQIGTIGADIGESLAIDGAGNLYLTGTTTEDLGGPNLGYGDAFLLKLDANGNEIWTQQVGTIDSESSLAVTVDSEGNAFISGQTRGNMGGLNAGLSDAFLTKFNSAGDELWTQQIGTIEDDISYAVAVDDLGGVYISGDTLGDLAGPNAGFWDTFLVKFVAPTSVQGDYNNNGVVDAADYTVWRDSLGDTGVGLPADGDNSGEVDALDYAIWSDNFGATASQTLAVPEPTAIFLLLPVITLISVLRARIPNCL